MGYDELVDRLFSDPRLKKVVPGTPRREDVCKNKPAHSRLFCRCTSSYYITACRSSIARLKVTVMSAAAYHIYIPVKATQSIQWPREKEENTSTLASR